MKKHLIFDFDGVIGDTLEQSVKIAMEIKRVGCDTEEEARQRTVTYLSKPNHSRNHDLTEKQKQEFLEVYGIWGEKLVQKGFELFDGFVNEIGKIENAKLSVVSSGSRKYVEPYSRRSGLNFTHILCAEHDLSKEAKVEAVCKDWGVDVRETFYFTDTTGDVLELQELLGLERIMGCSWGWHGEKILGELLPKKQILRRFEDIHNCLK